MAVSSSPVLSHSPIEHYLHQLHARYAALDDGQVADYIPELAKARPDWFGIDQEDYRSESETGHRNRAIGWMLRKLAKHLSAKVGRTNAEAMAFKG